MMANIYFLVSTMVILTATVLLSEIKSDDESEGLKRVCYFRYLRWPPRGMKRYSPEDIDTHMCTHIMVFGATLESSKVKVIHPIFEAEDNGPGWFEQLHTHIHRSESSAQVLLTVFINSGNPEMSAMMRTAESRSTFIEDTIAFVRNIEFDGIDLDFETPGVGPESPPEDKQRFTQLCQELRIAIDNEERSSEQNKLLLFAAMTAGSWHIKKAYEVPQLCAVLDMVGVMTYAMGLAHSQTKTIHTSPLFPALGANDDINVAGTAAAWIDGGCDRNKIIIGVPFFGFKATLTDPTDNGLEASILPKSWRDIGYNTACKYLSEPDAEVHRDPDQQIPYMTIGTTWVGYDDAESLTTKVQWIKEKDLGGFMIWVLDTDDYEGNCNAGKSPLLRALYTAATTC